MNRVSAEDHPAWLAEVLPLHERLSAAIGSLVENMLKKADIEYLSVIPRTKTLEGALEKIRRKEYRDPSTQLTDLSGVRVVTYLEDHAAQVAAMVRDLFEIDETNSRDRSAVLGDDKIGYRSTHFVCTLGKSRGELPEYEGIGRLKFEVQVRTVLQHAWAELAHDRSFKFGSALPSKIQRKLNLYSGLLEIVDGAFDEIAKEIDEYKLSLANKSTEQISAAELNSISVARFIADLSADLELEFEDNTNNQVLTELSQFGLNNIGDLQALATKDFKRTYTEREVPSRTSIGLLRDLMMYNDLDKYFGLGQNFSAIHLPTVAFLETKYPLKVIQGWFEKLHITVMPTRAVTKPPVTKRRRKKT